MEESQGHEGKCACGEGQGGRVLRKQQNSFLIRVSCIEAVATHSCPPEKGKKDPVPGACVCCPQGKRGTG